MATTLQKGLFGGDPVEMQLQQQKLWQSAYAGAQNPYEKIGLALGQIGSIALGGESTFQTKANAVNEAISKAGQQYQAGTAEYYKAIADSLPAEYSDSKEFATQKYLETKAKNQEVLIAASNAIAKNPELVGEFTAPLATSLLAKAEAAGWDKTKTPIPQTSAEISAFAKEFNLTKDPDYGRYVSLIKLAEKEAKNEQTKMAHEALTMRSIESTIARNQREVDRLEKDAKFDQGDRWNAEREAALSLFAANKIDPTKPLKGINLANTELVNAQKIALRAPFTGKASAKITPPGTTIPPATGGKPASQGGDLGQQVTASFGSYEPNKYEYRIVNGQVQRKAK